MFDLCRAFLDACTMAPLIDVISCMGMISAVDEIAFECWLAIINMSKFKVDSNLEEVADITTLFFKCIRMFIVSATCYFFPTVAYLSVSNK